MMKINELIKYLQYIQSNQGDEVTVVIRDANCNGDLVTIGSDNWMFNGKYIQNSSKKYKNDNPIADDWGVFDITHKKEDGKLLVLTGRIKGD